MLVGWFVFIIIINMCLYLHKHLETAIPTCDLAWVQLGLDLSRTAEYQDGT